MYEKSKQECGPPDRRMQQAFPIEVSWKLVRLFPPFNSTHLTSSAIQRCPAKSSRTLPTCSHLGSSDGSSFPADDFTHPPSLEPTANSNLGILGSNTTSDPDFTDFLPALSSEVPQQFDGSFQAGFSPKTTKISPSPARTCSPSSAVSSFPFL